MLLVPLHKKFDWKHPPYITLIIIAVNIIVFALFQLDDEQEVWAALQYYESSGLAEMEYRPALDYADKHGDHELYRALKNEEHSVVPIWVLSLQIDPGFMAALRNGEVIYPSSEVFPEWEEKRRIFDGYYNDITYVHYGLKPADPTPVSVFSHMFLHGGFGHLIGNMIFLLAIGLLVEATISGKVYLASYLLAGLGSAVFDIIFRSEQLTPGIGASGAIAGMMGAYAVLYGLKRIRFFYFIGVYFDYITLPAIVLLPLWIGNELVQMLLDTDSNVNFLAHIGGLCSGALIAFVVRQVAPSFNLKDLEATEERDDLEKQIERAREFLSELRPEAALPILKRLYNKHPDHREILVLYYESSRINTMGDEYHSLAHAIFSLQDGDVATDRLVLETFNEYLKLARPAIRMSPAMACHLAKRFIRQNATSEAERLIRVILSKKVSCPENKKLLTSFARLLEAQGRIDDSRRYLQLIPSSDTA